MKVKRFVNTIVKVTWKSVLELAPKVFVCELLRIYFLIYEKKENYLPTNQMHCLISL